MIVYRIAGNDRINDLDGTGAKLYGGRWNPRGFPMLYTSANSSLAILEKLVHTDLDLFTANLRIAEIMIDDHVYIEKIDTGFLKDDWNEYPSPDYLMEYGKEWILSARSLLLEVPSAINPLDSNYLVNPEHPQSGNLKIIKIYPLIFDPRLLAGA